MDHAQQRCCILGICCPPNSTERIAALAEYLSEAAGFTAGSAEATAMYKAAQSMIAEFKLVPY